MMDSSALTRLLVAFTVLLACSSTACASRLLEASSAQTDAQHTLHAGATFCSSSKCVHERIVLHAQREALRPIDDAVRCCPAPPVPLPLSVVLTQMQRQQ